MDVELSTVAEIEAQKAETLSAFSGLNLLHIKRGVAELLSQIGGQGIFDEYTKHDISHIDATLAMLNAWIIPDGTQEVMTTADWLLVVLGIYFHDLGMLVTKSEYHDRKQSDFYRFRDEELFSDDDQGKDYKTKIQTLPEDERERFLYQEFVRRHHAERVRNWIVGSVTVSLGVTDKVAEAVDGLLSPLTGDFRETLGIVCESHHADDLDDLEKYAVSKPFGNTSNETANVQYSAILLRTADLLHITKDRTPSIVFKTLNPTDPISQREWVKQMAVRAVRSQVKRDNEGKSAPSLPRDTIEVHARFTDENGFFGLIGYLDYAEKQLEKSYHWIAQTQKQEGSPHNFPWRYIDQTHIETVGFLREQFEFSIDQVKILDLLTGHTLYNDTSVVLRELLQNALDAVRLQYFLGNSDGSKKKGRVSVHWNTQERILVVADNGTGMTQEIVENNLLKVGASRYEEPKFKEQYPDFTPISRFGIGILTAFMVADDVEISTCHPDEDQARRMLLRSVHGKYLIRLLDKNTGELPPHIVPNGTEIRLMVRPSADVGDVVEIARKWVVIPDCQVEVTVDDGLPVEIGFDSPKEALEAEIEKNRSLDLGQHNIGRGKEIKVVQVDKENVSLAYALQWSEYFREWEYLPASHFRREEDETDENELHLGTCVEGIRVENSTPGYTGQSIYAIANAKGHSAPRTNVARSGLETTPESSLMVRQIYEIYCNHIKEEIRNLQTERSFSLTWAVNEVRYFLQPLLATRSSELFQHYATRSPDESRPTDWSAFFAEILKLPALVVEKDSGRIAMSHENLTREAHFWTVDSAFFRSVEAVIREIPVEASLRVVANALTGGGLALPEDPVLCTARSNFLFEHAVFDEREVSEIRVDRAERRIDLKWVNRSNPPLWTQPRLDWPKEIFRRSSETVDHFSRSSTRIAFANASVLTEGLKDEMAVQSYGETFFLPGCPVSNFMIELKPEGKDAETGVYASILHFLLQCVRRARNSAEATEFLDRWIAESPFHTAGFETKFDVDGLRQAVRNSSWKVFSTSLWERDSDTEGFVLE